MRLYTGLLLALALVGAACRDGTSSLVGSFSATVGGDLTLELSGPAVFGTTSSGGVEGFVIQLTRGDPTSPDFDIIGLGRFLTARPGVGTYDVVSVACTDCSANDFDAVFAFYRTDGSFGQFRSESGSLTIQEASADRIVGTFSFIAVRFATSTGVEAATLTVQGSFTAVPGPITG